MVEKEFVNNFSFQVVELKQSIPRLFHSRPAQLQRLGESFEVGNEANSVRISRRGQIWSVKHELLRFASQTLSPTFNSPLDC